MKKRIPSQVFQIKITLDGIRPPVWRRILISEKSTLQDLHDEIQAAFDWENYHLHMFTLRGEDYGDPATDVDGALEFTAESSASLKSLDLIKGTRFKYEYDFGDSWVHTLVVEKVFPFERGMKLPQCIAGKRARPPEDVGGIWGYQHFLEAMQDPDHPDHEHYMEWYGAEFDPEAFSLEEVNASLGQGRDWFGSPPGTAEALEAFQQPMFNPALWKDLGSGEGEQITQDLPLRRNVVTLLKYIQENKVTGTRSTGNLPRKVVEAVASRFVNPPGLETRIGEQVFRFQSEEDVWPVYFVHVLAQAVNLVSGGPGRRWGLTGAGEKFLELPAHAQVGILFHGWWYRVNWIIAWPVMAFGKSLPSGLIRGIWNILRSLPVGQTVSFEEFAKQTAPLTGRHWSEEETGSSNSTYRWGIKRIVIDQLEDFGVLATTYVEDPTYLSERGKLDSFSLTSLGPALLDSLLMPVDR